MRLLPHRVEIPHLGAYPAFMADDGRPLFTRAVATRIAEDWERLASQPDEPPRQAVYDADNDTFKFFDPATGEWLLWKGEQWGECTVYPIGEHAWSMRG